MRRHFSITSLVSILGILLVALIYSPNLSAEVLTKKPLRSQKHKEVVERRNVVKIGDFIKTDYQAQVKKFSLRSGGFSKINFRVHIGEKYGVIVNSILVLANGKQLEWKTVGARLSEGDNTFPLTVPKDATDIQVSFAHGQGSSVSVFLLR